MYALLHIFQSQLVDQSGIFIGPQTTCLTPLVFINTTNASWKKPNMLQVKSKIHCGLHFLIVVPTNLLRLDAPGWTEECKEHSLFVLL